VNLFVRKDGNMAIFTLNYEEQTGESKYISTLPLQSVLVIVNQLIANEAVKNVLEEQENKKQAIIRQAMDIATKGDSNNGEVGR